MFERESLMDTKVLHGGGKEGSSLRQICVRACVCVCLSVCVTVRFKYFVIWNVEGNCDRRK